MTHAALRRTSPTAPPQHAAALSLLRGRPRNGQSSRRLSMGKRSRRQVRRLLGSESASCAWQSAVRNPSVRAAVARRPQVLMEERNVSFWRNRRDCKAPAGSAPSPARSWAGAGRAAAVVVQHSGGGRGARDHASRAAFGAGSNTSNDGGVRMSGGSCAWAAAVRGGGAGTSRITSAAKGVTAPVAPREPRVSVSCPNGLPGWAEACPVDS